MVSNFYYVNQLSFNLKDNRVLYPYDLRVEFQQSELFYRINLHADYLLNYPDGGGLKVRFFAAKFGVWKDGKRCIVTRYEPKLLGVNGDEDYLYEDYFIGRSASYALEKPSIPNDGLAAQQIMNRDGGLKLRIDAYDLCSGQISQLGNLLEFQYIHCRVLFSLSGSAHEYFLTLERMPKPGRIIQLPAGSFIPVEFS